MEDRIFIGWPDGYFMTSLVSDFQAKFLEMVDDFGPPSVVEFRAASDGWIEGSADDLFEPDDITEVDWNVTSQGEQK